MSGSRHGRGRRRALLSVIAVGISAGACSTPSRPADSTLARPLSETAPVQSHGHLHSIRAAGRVRIGVKFDVPLFGLRDPSSAKLTGFDIEIARAIARSLFPEVRHAAIDTKIDFSEAISKNRERFLQDDVVDLVVSTYTINDARKQLVDFAGPYYVAGQDILAHRADVESGAIRGIADVNGRRVCSVTGSTSLANLRAGAPRALTSDSKDKYSQCFEALRTGAVDAMTTDDEILLGLAQGHPEFALTGNPFHTEPYGVGIAKGDDELRAFVNDVLDAMFTDGSWRRAFLATVGTTGAIAPNPPALDRY